MKRKNMGSTFDSWLREEGIEGEVTANAIRRAAARDVIRSSGNVFADMGLPDAAELGARARLEAAQNQSGQLVPAKIAAAPGIDGTKSPAAEKNADYLHSTLRERIVEHVFVGEALRWLWVNGERDVDVLRPEFDAGGYDLVLRCKEVERYIQFKTAAVGSKTARINASLRLMEKPGGCIIWIFVTNKLEMKMDSFLWLGGTPGEKLPSILDKDFAKHTKGNARGHKAKRPSQRVIPIRDFGKRCTFDQVMENLFGKQK